MTRTRSERRTAPSHDAGCIGDYLPIAGEHQLSITTPSVPPAGDLTGRPATQYGAGQFQFESKILVLGVEPTLDAAGFQARLQSAVRQLVPGVQVTARIAKGAVSSVQVPRIRGTPMTSLVPLRTIDGWWLGVTGQINSGGGFAVNGNSGFNRALARAVAQSVAFRGFVDADYRSNIPTDGAPLDAQFRRDDACTGGFNPVSVYARACTRFAGSTPTQPAEPPPPSPAPPNGVEMPNAGATCAIRIQSKMFLRPTATFATRNAAGQSYPEIPAGTAVLVTGPKVSQQRTLGLYPVSVAGRAGFGALNADDFLGCTLYAGPGGTAPTVSTRPPSASSTSTTPPAQRYPGIALLDTGGSSTSSTSTYAYGAVAFLAVLALGGAALYASRASERRAARDHRKPNGRRARRRGRRVRRAR